MWAEPTCCSKTIKNNAYSQVISSSCWVANTKFNKWISKRTREAVMVRQNNGNKRKKQAEVRTKQWVRTLFSDYFTAVMFKSTYKHMRTSTQPCRKPDVTMQTLHCEKYSLTHPNCSSYLFQSVPQPQVYKGMQTANICERLGWCIPAWHHNRILRWHPLTGASTTASI